MIKQLAIDTFIQVKRFPSGIGQITGNKVVEVKAGRMTLNKSNVEDKFKILNNHGSLVTKSGTYTELTYPFSTKEVSKRFDGPGKSKNEQITRGKTFNEDVKNKDQYLCSVGMAFEEGTVKHSEDKKVENYTREHSGVLVKLLNKMHEKDVIKIKNKNYNNYD